MYWGDSNGEPDYTGAVIAFIVAVVIAVFALAFTISLVLESLR